VKLEEIRPTGIPLTTPAPGNSTTGYNSILPAFRQVAAYDYFDLALKFEVNENMDMGLLVENLFDKQPPLLGAGVAGTAFNSGNTLPTTYDAVGRAYTLNARLRF
jgi:outer membrane receptor protein involved in Fe transport